MLIQPNEVMGALRPLSDAVYRSKGTIEDGYYHFCSAFFDPRFQDYLYDIVKTGLAVDNPRIQETTLTRYGALAGDVMALSVSFFNGRRELPDLIRDIIADLQVLEPLRQAIRREFSEHPPKFFTPPRQQ
ncbi:hypothetical protein J4464_05555 [Candidatus Woesearchaeota archaeon]|nr:hypothetical protein [Candidatus Woesearchaeota archaeon]